MELSPGELAQIFSNLAATTARSNATALSAEKAGDQAQNVQASEYKEEAEKAAEKKKGGVFSKIGKVLGTVAGGAVGGPIGAGLGGSLGKTLGGGIDHGELDFDLGEFAIDAAIGTGSAALGGAIDSGKLGGLGKVGGQDGTKIFSGELGKSAAKASLAQPSPLAARSILQEDEFAQLMSMFRQPEQQVSIFR